MSVERTLYLLPPHLVCTRGIRIIKAKNLRDARAQSRTSHPVGFDSNDIRLLHLHVELPGSSDPSSIPVLNNPRMIASLLYDAWLLNIAHGGIIVGASERLRQQTCGLLLERDCNVLVNPPSLMDTHIQ
ncbi:hypothetical protein ATCCBAA256_21210 [Mycobacterium montefiorense]|uniref:hypothetical protein n=1 Tax=Mycobacterium montefiorense TaxID=154654 RepID=UPI0021DD34A8|nr:hypothetical protein [Mycobacterium montefiorense]GLE52558.1 hypothetical protein ATCCBAA256_21210 [Mycobacterium montefiorense]